MRPSFLIVVELAEVSKIHVREDEQVEVTICAKDQIWKHLVHRAATIAHSFCYRTDRPIPNFQLCTYVKIPESPQSLVPFLSGMTGFQGLA